MTDDPHVRARRALATRFDLERLLGVRELPLARALRARPPLEPGTVESVSAEAAGRLGALAREVAACTRCEISRSRRCSVFGEGNPRAELMFVGEAPGAEEDRTGRPFVGPAGQLLTKIIASIGLDRSEVYIANVLKCRPPGNRNPMPDETGNCFPYLEAQIETVKPRVICTLGTPATCAVLGVEGSIGRFRGRIHPRGKAVVIPTYHPAYLLRNPAEKIKTWHDIQLVAKALSKTRE